MSKEYKNSRGILILGIIGTLFLILAITMFSLYVGLGSRRFMLVESIHGFDWATSVDAIITMTFGIIGIVFTVILSLITAIKIFMGKYNNKGIDNLRTMMGILTMIVIGPIGAIIFGAIAMTKLKSQPKDFINTEVKQKSEPVI